MSGAVAGRGDWFVAGSDAPEVSVVVPVFNEAPSLEALHEGLTTALRTAVEGSYEIIAVDDGSSDDSFWVLKTVAAADPCLRVVRLRRNFGQTAAFLAGFDRARGRVIVTIDADLQNDPADIPRLLEKLNEGYDAVSGWRVQRQDPFWTRVLPSQVANRLISNVTGLALHDYGCSLKAYRREALEGIELYGELHRFLPAIASAQGITVAEVPVSPRPRRSGSSNYGLGRTLRVLLDLVTVRFLLTHRTRPMQVFGLVGLASAFLGGVMAMYLAALKLLTGARLADRPLLLLAVLLIVVGVQFIGIGLVGELVVRASRQGVGPASYAVREEVNPPSEPSG